MAKVKLEVQSIDKVSTLIELLDKYQADLPKELNVSLMELADCEHCEIGTRKLLSMGIDTCDAKLMADGVSIDNVISFNKVLKRLTTGNNGYLYPLSFSIKDRNDNAICEW